MGESARFLVRLFARMMAGVANVVGEQVQVGPL
jgi:hypothetical protein